MNKGVQYAYGATETIYNRYTDFSFLHNTTPDVYTGKIDLSLAGYWKYEVYEVVWKQLTEVPTTVTIDAEHAPATETDVVLPRLGVNIGEVMGLVTKGKMYVAEKSGIEEVTYSQNGKGVQSITIIEAGAGYTSAPTIVISGGGNPITTATATCTISGGAINTVTITDPGNGYTSKPTVTITGTATTLGRLVASIEKTNYIYAG
tara:strand:+ start:884 stop:1495 length:612 start_codon:yes stop_codon:yes gene_type:complete